MLVCRDISEMTTDYLEGALPTGMRLGMRFHLAICRMCRRHMRQLRQTLAFLRRMPREPISAELEDRLVARISGDPELGRPAPSD